MWSQYYTTKSLKLYYPWSVANVGLSLTTILLSLTYVATLWTVDYRINFQCSDLHDQTIGLVTRHIPSFSDNP